MSRVTTQFAIVVLFLALLTFAESGKPEAGATPTQDDTLLSIDLPHDPPTIKDNKFLFSVTFTSELPGKQFTAPFVSCGQSVSCLSKKTDPSRGFSTIQYEATLPSDPPAAVELAADLYLHTAAGDQQAKRTSRIVDLGFRKYSLQPTIDTKQPLEGDTPRRLSFHFKDGADTVIPVFPVDLHLSSDCADFSKSQRSEEQAKFAPSTTAQFKSNSEGSEEIVIQPHFWSAETCEVNVVEVLQGSGGTREIDPPPIIFTVKPAYTPSFLMALAGALCQYLVFGAARLIVEAQKLNPSKNPLGGNPAPGSPAVKVTGSSPYKRLASEIFIGPAYSNLISVLLKGVLAFFIAGIMKDPNVFGITVEKGNFYGFFTLGIFFGFWPLEKLLQKFAEIAGLKGVPTDQTDSGKPPVVPPTAPRPSEAGG